MLWMLFIVALIHGKAVYQDPDATSTFLAIILVKLSARNTFSIAAELSPAFTSRVQ